MTKHAVQRFSQRGMTPSDVELILEIGSEVEDGYLVRAKDRQVAERFLQDLLARIRRAEGKRIVVAEGNVVTGYRANRRETRRLLRKAGRA